MPLVFPVVLLLILGAVTLASRSTNSFLAATKQSDGEAARQAAESGLSRVMVALNPFGRGANDPYVSFLLASKWTEGSGWAITKLPAATVKDRLGKCGLATRGLRVSNAIPTGQSVYDDLLPPPGTDPSSTPTRGLIGSAGQATQLRFKVVRYEPPPTTPPASTWPSACSDFTTVTGGSGLITVEGSVWRNGKQMASHRLTRHLDFEGWPMVDLPDDTFPSPGPPVGLRIEGTGNGVGILTSAIYKSKETRDARDEVLSNSIGALRPQCSSCTPAGNFTNKFPVDSSGKPLDLPEFPDWEKEPKPQGWDKPETLSINQLYTINETSPRCQLSKNNTQINCFFKDISVAPSSGSSLSSPYQSPVAIIRVDTSKFPVNLYIQGKVGDPSLVPTWVPGNPPAAIPPDGKIVFEHCIKDCSSANPVFFDHTKLDRRLRWSRLRIFGSKDQPQTFYIASKSPQATSLHGLFLWLPKGELNYGNPTYTWDATDKKWGDPPAPESAPEPAEIMATWWVNKLNLNNLTATSGLKFILPLYGNPEALSSILPSRVEDSNGNLDPRFPVYSNLLRPRSYY